MGSPVDLRPVLRAEQIRQDEVQQEEYSHIDHHCPHLPERDPGHLKKAEREHQDENDIPDIIERFRNRDQETERKRTEQSFFVEKQDIVDNQYDLSINKYKEVEYVPIEYPSTQEIMANLHELEMEIAKNLAELDEMLEKEKEE